MGISTQILGLIVSLSFLVIIHELGHYTFARIFHTRVDKFYMFFNPYFSIVRFKKVNGKMRFKFFSRNTPDPLKKMMREDGTPALDEKGKQLYEPMTQADLDALPDDDWRKYPETTEWGIGWLPFGGYCAINGMIDDGSAPGSFSDDKDNADSVLVRVKSGINDRFCLWVLKYGESVEIVRPADIRKRFLGLLESIAKMYSDR